jgi:Uma2 family endonuclease
MMADMIAINDAEHHGVLETDVLYEVVDGKIVEPPSMGTEQEVTAGILHGRLCQYADTTKLGRAVVETLFDFTKHTDRKRRPDVAYVASDRWPRSKPVGKEDGWPVIPNLTIEVISPSNSWDEILDRIHEYFHVGVQRVWIVSTSKKQVHVYTSPTEVRILSQPDELSDEDLLPGFRLGLTDLFEVVG